MERVRLSDVLACAMKEAKSLLTESRNLNESTLEEGISSAILALILSMNISKDDDVARVFKSFLLAFEYGRICGKQGIFIEGVDDEAEWEGAVDGRAI